MVLFKKCRACDEDVPEDHIGKCSKCGEEKGYAFSRTIGENITADYFVNMEKLAMINAWDDAINTQTDLLKNEANYYNLEKLLKKLDFLKSEKEKSLKKIDEKSRKVFELTKKLPKKSVSSTSFTIGSVIGSKEQNQINELNNSLIECEKIRKEYEEKIMHLESEIEAKDTIEDSLMKKILEIQDVMSDVRIKLGWKQTLGFGVIASFMGSIVYAIWTFAGTIIPQMLK